MKQLTKAIIQLIARIGLSLVFIFQGITSLVYSASTQSNMIQQGLGVQTSLLYYFGVTLMLTGGVMVLIGFKTRIGILLLLIFLIPTTFIYQTDFESFSRQVLFLKNVAIASGLLLLLTQELNRWTVDAFLQKKKQTKTS